MKPGEAIRSSLFNLCPDKRDAGAGEDRAGARLVCPAGAEAAHPRSTRPTPGASPSPYALLRSVCIFAKEYSTFEVLNTD